MTTVQLGEVARFINGAAFKPSDWGNAGLPIVRIQNLTGSSNSFNHTEKEISPIFVVNEGDMLVSWSASLGVYIWPGPTALLNQHIFKVLPRSCVQPRYLYYAIEDVLDELKAKTHGSTMKHVVRGDFEKTRIPLPPLEKQQQIIRLLDRAAEIRRRADASRAKARAIIPALFLDVFGDPATNPKGWPVQMLAELAVIGSGLTKGRRLNGTPTVPTPYLRVANVQADRLDLSEIKLIDATADDRQRCRLKPGDLLMTEGGDIDKLGRCAMWQGEIDLCLHQNHVFRVRMGALLHPGYAQAFMQCEAARGYFLRVAKRTTGIASINKTQLGQLPVLVPPLPLQAAFAEQAQRIEATVRALDTAATKAEVMAAALSAKVFG